MGRGRKPTPTKLKNLRGNPGKRAINRDEPEVEEGVPECPKDLPDKVKVQWERIVPTLLKMGVLNTTDFVALSLLCDALADWFEASEFLALSGTILVNDRNDMRVNAYYRIKIDADNRIRSWGSEFGLTPASRSKLVVKKPGSNLGKSRFFSS